MGIHDGFGNGQAQAKAVAVGTGVVGAVKAGYTAAGGEAEKLVLRSTLDAAREYLADVVETGDAVLFLNDLPDAW